MKKILIIEDNFQDQKIMGHVLKRAGFENITFADSGHEGVDVCQQERPDIVICDTILPGIDGFETCRQIRSILDYEVFIIVMTGHIDAVDASQAREVRADDYVVKTAGFEDLIRTMRAI
ncbi:MAG: two-component system alkaline phosphatase synthesis response regulator PhoP [Candidatus Omnitrophota bacterium]|jgi:two-component system alkaline phosphatase synthesis response regulator PhoP